MLEQLCIYLQQVQDNGKIDLEQVEPIHDNMVIGQQIEPEAENWLQI